jgi:CxxC-x17-CxxC domain-containing protein
MEFQDRQIACIDCGQPFVFTAGEQEFYERKGFKEEPKRCKPCREARKTRRGAQSSDGPAHGNGYGNGGGNHGGGYDDDAIGNRAPASRGARGGGGGGGGGGRGARGGFGGGEREMFDAVCAQCGAQTRVPFRPIAGRPVYCRECYGGRRAGGAV